MNIKYAIQRIVCVLSHTDIKAYRSRLYCKRCGWCVFKGRTEPNKNIYTLFPPETLETLSRL